MADDMTTSLICVTRLPVIEEQLQQLKNEWLEKVETARNLVCTEETVQTIKQIRADMRKEFQAADDQRKAVKAQYMAPWDSVEATFKECVKESFLEADGKLKDIITCYEDELKKECLEKVEAYFNELAAMECIDFLSFDQAMKLGGIKISLEDTKRSTPSRLFDKVGAVIADIAVGMEQIMKMDDSAEIMAEFKECLSVGKAVAAVQDRKRKVQEERAAQEARQAVQERFDAAENKVTTILPPIVSAVAEQENSGDDPIFEEFTFTVFGCRKSTLIKIRNYLKQEGISYE